MAMDGPKGAGAEGLASALELSDLVFRAGTGRSMAAEFPLLFREDNGENLRVFTDEGRVVALVGMVEREVLLLGTRHRVGCIGSVCTHPDYRGQGLATRLMEDARRKALADRVEVLLVSGGRSLYRRLGYVDVGGYLHCEVGRRRGPERGRYELRPWRPADLPALQALHGAEPVRFVRPPDDFRALLELDAIMSSPAATEVVCPRRGERPVAYLTCRSGARIDRDEASDALIAVELAGSRYAAAAGLVELLGRDGVRKVTVRTLACDAEMAELARAFGWRRRPAGFHGTVGVIDPEGFWAACVPLFAERLGPQAAGRLSLSVEGERVRITCGEQELALAGMAEFTGLVFLPAHRRAELELDAPGGSELGRALEGLFPLPLVDYGLNYI